MPAQVFPLLVSTALLLLGNGLVGTLLPLRWAREGVSAETIALIGALNYFGMLLGAACGTALVRWLGSRRAGRLSAALFAGSTLLILLVTVPGAYGLARLASGFGVTVMILVIENGLNALATPARRSRLLGAYMIVYYLAQAAGAALSEQGGELCLLTGAALVIFLAGLPVPATATPAPTAGSRLAVAYRLWQLAPGGCIGAFTAGVMLGTYYSLAPLYARAIQPEPGAAGLFMAVAMLGGVAGMMPIAVCADRQGRIPWLIAVNLMVAVVSVWFCFDGSLHWLAAFLFGTVLFACYPLASATVNAAVPKELRLSANGLVVLLTAVGGCFGPLAAGGLVTGLGPIVTFIVIGAAAAFTATALTIVALAKRAYD